MRKLAREPVRWIGLVLLASVAACGGDDAGPPPADCQDALVKNPAAVSGPTVIAPPGGPAMTVYCDQTVDGGGWILTYKVRSNVDSADNPWWDQVMPGTGTTFPSGVGQPATSTEGPTAAARAALTAAIGATEWRATTVQGGIVTFDLASSYGGTGGRGLRCFASGTCGDVDQTCSDAITDGRVLTNTLGGPIAAGGTGYVCDVGWTGCDFCVDWSSVRTDAIAGGSSANAVQYVGDSSIGRTDATTLYWIR